jgi:hypothetical protein
MTLRADSEAVRVADRASQSRLSPVRQILELRQAAKAEDNYLNRPC